MNWIGTAMELLSRIQVQANWWPLAIIGGCLLIYTIVYWFMHRNEPEIEGISNE
jgi:hypothetical protein